MRLGINGRFYGAPVTGVQRFAREVTARIPAHSGAVLFTPANIDIPPAVRARSRIVPGRLTGNAWEQLELPRRARAEDCDIVLQLSGPGPLRGGPCVLIIHDVLPLTHPHWFNRRFALWYRLALRRAAQRAAAVITVSEWANREIQRILRVGRNRIHVVRQGMAPFGRPADRRDVARVRQDLKLPEQYLLALAGGDPRKNVPFLQGLIHRWRERSGSAPTLVVVGGDVSRVHARGVTAPSAHTNVRLPGRVHDDALHALYTGAACFCFPSLAEGFGRPPLEAMACGTPAVVAPYGPAREVLGDAARIVALQPDAWINAIEPLLEPGAERERIVERGRRHALSYNWDETAAAVLEICRKAAAPSGAAAPAAVSARISTGEHC